METRMFAVPADVIGFWTSAGPSKWFAHVPAFDEAIRLKFEPVHHAAACGGYDAWRLTADGCLALLLLLDQFPRNLYRGSAHAYATDPLARTIADHALAAGFDACVPAELRFFCYMPFMHSEAIADQDRAFALMEAYDAETGEIDQLQSAVMHRDIIRRFGRFPHRNHALGRGTTPEEQTFLNEGGFAG
jgi:uncharacterized protein (DUF924 family)